MHSKHDLPTLLLGDFNARTSLLDDFTNDSLDVPGLNMDDISIDLGNDRKKLESLGLVTSRFNIDRATNNNGYKLIEFCKVTGLNIVNGRLGKDKGIGSFTCHSANGKSLIDYAIASPSLFPLIENFYVDDFDKTMSDVHSPICLSLSNLPKKNESVKLDQPKETVESVSEHNFEIISTKWNNELTNEYKNAFIYEDIQNHTDKLESLVLHDLDQNTMDELSKDLCSILIKPAKSVGISKLVKNTRNKKIPMNLRRNKNKEWFNEDCEKLRKEYMQSKNKLREANNTDEKNIAQNNFNQKFYAYKKFIKKAQRKHNKELQKHIRNLKSSDPKAYWNILNKSKDSNKTMGNISLNVFMKHFKKLSSSPIQDTDNVKQTFTDESINVDINRLFSLDEILTVVKKLKNRKTSGIDCVVNEFLKNCPECVYVNIVKLFNIVLQSGIIPTDWCIGIIQPLFKNKGSADNPDNYRGITLLSCIGKLFTSCLNARLSFYVEGAGIMGEEQAGFRNGYCTLDHIFVLHSLIGLYSSRNKRLFCAFIDYQKAFDLVDRTSLWCKLYSYGINGQVMKVIRNLYEQAKSCVKKGSDLSDFFSCNIGVRQGENLSPLLFAIYLNDFELYISGHYDGLSLFSSEVNKWLSDDDVELFLKLFVLLYADDTIVLAESPEDLNKALKAVHEYCSLWKLTVNTSKTKIVIFSKGKIRKYPKFKFGDEYLDVVDDYVYLGTTINYNGKFNKAINKQVNQAKRAMFALITKSRRLCLPVDIQCDLFEKTVVPILLYGSEVWGFCDLQQIEIFYRKFLKNVLRLNKSTPNCMIYGEVGKLPLKITVYSRMINYWFRLLGGKQSKLSSIMYRLLYTLDNNNIFTSPWLAQIKSILVSSGIPFLWAYQQQITCNANFYKQLIEKKLKDMGVQKWSNEINDTRQCSNYKIFKNILCSENYLTELEFSERIKLCKFRCGNHNLPVSKNRYVHDLNPADAHCNLCDYRDTGDEFHYLFVCKAFKQQREMYLKRYYYTNPNTCKFKQLFNLKSGKNFRNMVKFVCYIISCFP